MEKLRNDGMPAIKMSQVKYQIAKYDNTNRPRRDFSLRDITEWADAHSARPNDVDVPFVTKFWYTAEAERDFRMFISTKRLIGFAKHVSSP